jgi:hypothetical protein
MEHAPKRPFVPEQPSTGYWLGFLTGGLLISLAILAVGFGLMLLALNVIGSFDLELYEVAGIELAAAVAVKLLPRT